MRFAILRREPCFRLLALTLPMVMLVTWPMAAVPATLTRFDRDFGYGDMLHVAFPLLLAWGSAFAFLPLRVKVWSYEAALPVSLLDLLRSRIAAFFLAMAVPVLGFTLVFLTVREGRVVVPVLRIAANLLTLAGVLALLPFAWSPTSSRVSGFRAGGLALVAIGVVALVKFSWSGALYALLIPVLYWRFQRETPVVFAQEELGGRVARKSPLDSLLEGLSPLRLVIWRSTFLRPRALLVLAATAALFGLAHSNPYLLFMFLFQVPWLLGRLGLNVLNGIDALPVSRARLVVPALLPSLLALWAGVWLQRYSFRPPPSWSLLAEQVRMDATSPNRVGPDGEYANHIVGPASLWRLHFGTEPAIVTAPWGESARLTQHPIFWGAAAAVVNPYDVEPTSSVRFLGWQLARAVEATTGVRVAEEELLTAYSPRRDRDEAVVVADLWADSGRVESALAHPPIASRPTEGMLAYSMVTVGWALAVAYLLRGGVPPVDRWAWKRRLATRVFWIGSAALLALAAFAVTLEDEVVFPTLMSICERRLDLMLGGSLLGWFGLPAALASVVLLVAARRLPHIEVPPAPKVGWRQQEASVY